MSRRPVVAFVAVLVAAGGALFAQTDRERTEMLSRRAGERIRALHDEADRLASRERSLLNELRRLEIERDIRTTELARARAELTTAAAELVTLDRQVAAIAAEEQAALPDVKARMVTLYKLGPGQYARLLLSAADLRHFGQAVRLVSAMAEQDRRRLAQQQQRRAALERARAASRDRQVRGGMAQTEAARAEAAAAQALTAHDALIRDIDTRRDLNAQYASELLAAQQKLQASLDGLATAAAALPIAPFRGDLPWPVAGAIRHQFGMAEAGRPPLRGIEIDGTDGAVVRAVHDGTVAYAAPFTGYGRLVIVDHGSQTFTVYGNLGEIRVATGARVDPGSPVGTLGVGGNGATLYFELRVDGRAVDPLQWLSKR